MVSLDGYEWLELVIDMFLAFRYPQILTMYADNMDLPITTCEAVALGHMASKNATRMAMAISNR